MAIIRNLCFFGDSGAGKTTAADIATKLLSPKFTVIRCDVATPLRELQNHCQRTFDLPESGDPLNSTGFASDGKLLSFLAQHYEPHLALNFEKRFNARMELLHKTSADLRKVIFINADCRNNSYAIVKKLGFTFIKVTSSFENRQKRTQQRDMTPFTNNPTEASSKIVADFCLTNDGTRLEFEYQTHSLLIELNLLS